ncbi:MAG: glycosyltransferase family 4 protein [bacterium]
MKVLFIARTFSDAPGGMQQVSRNLLENLPVEKISILNKSVSRLSLVWFLPYSFFMGLIFGASVDLIYLTDGVMAPVGRLLGKIYGKPVVATMHGLELTYNNWFYNLFVKRSFAKLTKIICVSNFTKSLCLQNGIAEDKLITIPSGYSKIKLYEKNECRQRLISDNIDLKDHFTLITVGRLVKRKGVLWFLQNVFPKLGPDMKYLIIGDGPEHESIRKFIWQEKLKNRVYLIKNCSNTKRDILLSAADLFLMPNIKVAGDVEGFGLVALEAALTLKPIVASAVDGLTSAVSDQMGILCPEKDTTCFVNSINKFLNEEYYDQFARSAYNYVKTTYTWEKTINNYLNCFKEVIL